MQNSVALQRMCFHRPHTLGPSSVLLPPENRNNAIPCPLKTFEVVEHFSGKYELNPLIRESCSTRAEDSIRVGNHWSSPLLCVSYEAWKRRQSNSRFEQVQKNVPISDTTCQPHAMHIYLRRGMLGFDAQSRWDTSGRCGGLDAPRRKVRQRGGSPSRREPSKRRIPLAIHGGVYVRCHRVEWSRGSYAREVDNLE